jgi:ribosomal protein L14E/L6E/L27E
MDITDPKKTNDQQQFKFKQQKLTLTKKQVDLNSINREVTINNQKWRFNHQAEMIQQ